MKGESIHVPDNFGISHEFPARLPGWWTDDDDDHDDDDEDHDDDDDDDDDLMI